jgi:hypothetical protein
MFEFFSEEMEVKMKKCVLYDRPCIECGECNRCDLDPSKICDNCCKCIDKEGVDYSAMVIEDIIDGEENVLPCESSIDRQELKKAWQQLKDSGKWEEPIPEDIQE